MLINLTIDVPLFGVVWLFGPVWKYFSISLISRIEMDALDGAPSASGICDSLFKS